MFQFIIHRGVTSQNARVWMKGGLQVHLVKSVPALDVAGQKGPLHELDLVTRRSAIGLEMAGMGQAERRQRDRMLVARDAVLLARMTQESGDGILGCLRQRRQRPLHGLGCGLRTSGSQLRGLGCRLRGGHIFGTRFEQRSNDGRVATSAGQHQRRLCDAQIVVHVLAALGIGIRTAREQQLDDRRRGFFRRGGPMQRRIIGDQVALIDPRTGIQQQAGDSDVSAPGRLPQRTPELDLVVDLGSARQQQLEQSCVPLERGPHERRPEAAPEKFFRPGVRPQVHVGAPVEQQADGIQVVGSRSGHQRSRAKKIHAVGIHSLVEQVFDGSTVAGLACGENERVVARVRTDFHIGPRGHEQAGLVLGSRSAQQSSGAGLVGGVHIGPGLEQQFQHGNIRVQRRRHQQSVAGLVARLKVRAVLQQRLHGGVIAGADGLEETIG